MFLKPFGVDRKADAGAAVVTQLVPAFPILFRRKLFEKGGRVPGFDPVFHGAAAHGDAEKHIQCVPFIETAPRRNFRESRFTPGGGILFSLSVTGGQFRGAGADGAHRMGPVPAADRTGVLTHGFGHGSVPGGTVLRIEVLLPEPFRMPVIPKGRHRGGDLRRGLQHAVDDGGGSALDMAQAFHGTVIHHGISRLHPESAERRGNIADRYVCHIRVILSVTVVFLQYACRQII